MSKKSMKTAAKLGLGAAAACALCGIPLTVPIIVSLFGAGISLAGQWVLGGVLLVGAGAFLLARRRKKCGCTASKYCPSDA